MIIAIDFDGILAKNSEAFPEIGPPNYDMISFTRELIDMGHEVILWTSRTDQALKDAVAWCKDRGLYFCAVNDNAPSNVARYIDLYPNGTRKVHADIYIDDHSLAFQFYARVYTYEEAINKTISIMRRILNDER